MEHPGRISDTNRGTLLASWIFAGFWNLVSIPVGVVGARAAWQEGNPAGYVALLFPLAGLAMLAWAVQNTLRYRRYGVSWLELSTLPAAIGRSVAGIVRVGSQIQSGGGFEVTLRCVQRRTTGGGKSRSTTEKILWQEERRLRGDVIRDARGFSTQVPIRFAIPVDARPSDRSNPRDQIVWRLLISADVPGVDYAATFELPVVAAAEGATAAEEMDTIAQPDEFDPEAYRQPPTSRIAVSTNRRGTEILFPALRNPGVAAGCVVFLLVWTGVMIALVHFKAPLLFPIVFGLFWILLLIGTLQHCFGVSRATAQEQSLALADGYFTLGRERTIPVQDISGIDLKIGMQAGSRPYYDLMVVRKNGKQVAAGRWIRDKREAEWLAATLKRVLGLSRRRSEVPAGHDG